MAEDAAPETLAMLERRRIEAEILGHVHATLTDTVGREAADAAVGEAVRRSSLEQARRFADAVGGNTNMRTFIERGALWRTGNALETEVLRETETEYEFNVTRCRYAEMYRAMGLGGIGHLLSCNRDGTFTEGYDSRLKLTRTQTIMGGASHCDFRYRYEADDGASVGSVPRSVV